MSDEVPLEREFPFPAYPNGWFAVGYGDEVAAGTDPRAAGCSCSLSPAHSSAGSNALLLVPLLALARRRRRS